jgi:hypothetical protein
LLLYIASSYDTGVTTARLAATDSGDGSPASPPQRPCGDLVLRWPHNWTAVVFFAVLAGLHLCVCVPAFVHGRIEGYMSLTFAAIFTTVALGCFRLRSELAVLPTERCVRLRTRVWRFVYERQIPFNAVRGVRLTLCDDGPHAESQIELLGRDGNDVTCPPTAVPRQEALCLAMTIDVPLFKAYASNSTPRQIDSSRT